MGAAGSFAAHRGSLTHAQNDGVRLIAYRKRRRHAARIAAVDVHAPSVCDAGFRKHLP